MCGTHNRKYWSRDPKYIVWFSQPHVAMTSFKNSAVKKTNDACLQIYELNNTGSKKCYPPNTQLST